MHKVSEVNISSNVELRYLMLKYSQWHYPLRAYLKLQLGCEIT